MENDRIKLNIESKQLIKKGLKIIRNGLLGIMISTVTLGTAHAIKVHHDIKSVKYNDDNVTKIVNHYSGQLITIVALNDSQGVNLNPCFWEDAFPNHLGQALSSKNEKVTLINAASLKFNKTHHIDKMLIENLSFKDILLLNLEGAKAFFSKISNDIGSPLDFGFLGNLIGEKPEEGDSEIRIADYIKSSKNPIILYFSGANDLMFQINNNPTAIKKYDSDGNIKQSFLYSLKRAQDPKVLDSVIDGIEENFKNLYALNKTSKIYALSLYIPQSTSDNEEMSAFINLIERYNIKLEELCKKYGVRYISYADLKTQQNRLKDVNFHISEVEHKLLAVILVDAISKDIDQADKTDDFDFNIQISSKGLSGFGDKINQGLNNVSIDDIFFDEDYLTYIYDKRKREIMGEVVIVEKAKRKSLELN